MGRCYVARAFMPVCAENGDRRVDVWMGVSPSSYKLRRTLMAYNKFKIEDIKVKLNYTINGQGSLFSEVQPVQLTDYLATTLQYNIPLAVAVHTEKARSEFIVAPILIDLKKALNNQISLFSGVELNVDDEKELRGICDFIICQSPEQLYITAPIITIVEAKKDNVKDGLGQCMASMVAAQLFNEQKGNNTKTVYGVVTTGTIWHFLKLKEQTIYLDVDEYYINTPDKIFGILLSIVDDGKSSL
jgi:hypothetical protein